jgi:SUR7/PalI family
VSLFLPSSHPLASSIHHYNSRAVRLIAGILAMIGFFNLAIASAIATVIMIKATDLVNLYGNEVGLYANRGNKYLAITWAAAMVMFLAVFYWTARYILGRRARRREWAEK